MTNKDKKLEETKSKTKKVDENETKTKKVDIDIDASNILKIFNKSDKNYFHSEFNAIVPETLNKFKSSVLAKYDNDIDKYNSTFLVLTRKNVYVDGKLTLVSLSNQIMEYTNKLFNLNKFISKVTNLQCIFKTEDNNTYYEKNNNYNMYFIDAVNVTKSIMNVFCQDFKFIELIVEKYFKTLNELVVYLYVYHDVLVHNDIETKYKFKCKRNFNEPNIVYQLSKSDIKTLVKFGEKKDRIVKPKKVKNDNKEPDYSALVTPAAENNWSEVVDETEEEEDKSVNKHKNKSKNKIDKKHAKANKSSAQDSSDDEEFKSNVNHSKKNDKKTEELEENYSESD
ncbi:unknown similar to AMEV053 [Mythimna separata entomopoxvirus 'L']|uniref:Uncharacterized protein n=1 Tax=Mythimna separata entomopoxvirus 'L' TaxID=1293572 RepID=A0A916P799_9POXV|nr:unknown similar to AMEV053 [Mythimna separata entomopoxvirus 'L']CCU56276.1 unknown similar to AMEV053 [Mythimna separata entomopoxvirus 'L']